MLGEPSRPHAQLPTLESGAILLRGLSITMGELAGSGSRADAEQQTQPSAEALLARRAVAGERDAERAVWDLYGPPVRRYIRRALGPGLDAQDLTQEVFLQVFARLQTLRNVDSLRSFVFAIAVNQVRMELRRRKIRQLIRLTDSGRMPDVRAASAEPDLTVTVRRLYAVLDRLKVSEREVFVLRFLEGLELTEVAAATGISLATVKRRLEQAGRKLLELVQQDVLLANFLAQLESEGDRHAR